MKNKKNGFTLIELLVVIAIISLLSSIILASLNSARGKASNSAIKEDLNNMRSAAELLYSNKGTYGTVCLSGQIPPTLVMYSAATAAGGNGGECNAISTSWAADVQLKVDEVVGAVTYHYWCIDNMGNGRGEANSLSGATACP